MARLSVNINKLATIRNARGGNNPDLVEWAKKIESYGAHGITIHPRPDERHIRRSDVSDLKKVVKSEFNIEGYPSDDFIKLVKATKPEQCTLVPDPPEVLTSNAGFIVSKQYELLEKSLNELSPITRVSVFVEPDTFNFEDAKTLKKLGAHRVELYTEEYAKNNDSVSKYRKTADLALEAGLELNAGHDLDLNNLEKLISVIPEIKEVSIGHALICEALDLGMKETISKYLKLLSE